jgi:hypothetical protein
LTNDLKCAELFNYYAKTFTADVKDLWIAGGEDSGKRRWGWWSK